MKKKMFMLIILLMSISLIGIITVQIFWIGNAIDIRDKQFSKDVNFALTRTNQIIYKRDFIDFTVQFMDFFQTKKFVKQADFTKFVYEQINTSTNETFRFSSSGIYENNYYKSLNDFYKNDSLLILSLRNKNDVYKVKNSTNNTELSKVNLVERFTFFNNLSEIEKISLEDAYQNKDISIYQRVSEEVIEDVLRKELSDIGIEIAFDYGVFSQGILTKIKSKNFNIQEGKIYKTPLFNKNSHTKNDELYVTFPKKEHYILSDIGMMLLLSVFFTLIIILAFVSSLHQLIKQKKISSIKTDFINNMTHEFKTPIATINLALDAIKNPKVIDDNTSVLKYVSMMKEENKRMHSQVENVLRISKLEKNQLDIIKTRIDFYETLETAIKHVNLLLKAKSGQVKFYTNHTASGGLGSKIHLTNVFVNILENAIKYSKNSPKIDIFIDSSTNYFSVQIVDNGIGMSKTTQKQAFDKFYREQRGNVHNVKGHGLGLAYVKKIVVHHQGKIFLESEKGRGTRITVKLPLVS